MLSAMKRPALAFSILGFLFVGCPRETSGSDASVPDTGTVVPPESACSDGMDDDGDGTTDCADTDCVLQPVCLPDAGFVECEGLFEEADEGIAPLDVVWVIDSSGSMDQEAMIVARGMNAFAAAIGTAGIPDYHVVVISQRGWVTVPDPLGSDPSHFLAIDEFVDSDQPLSDALARYPDYAAFLRPDASLHFVFVTDDDSTLTSTMFLEGMHDLVDRDFVVHAIASPDAGGMTSTGACDGEHGLADAIGTQYLAASSATGGLFENICTSDWDPLFARLLAVIGVAEPLPCTFVIPEPPMGETFDRERVNVRHAPGDGSEPITYPRSDDCASGSGWHYDDPVMPTEVILCPMSCSTVAADTTGRIDVQFGCATLLL